MDIKVVNVVIEEEWKRLEEKKKGESQKKEKM
jgi:hypothetical protein